MASSPQLSWTSLRKPLHYAMGTALILVSGLYVYGILEDNFAQLAQVNLALSLAEWSVLLLGVLGTLVIGTLYHVLAVRRIEPSTVASTRIALAYALGQIVRYVPGKIVGVIFQTRFLSGQLRTATIVLALLVQTVYEYLWTLVFAGSILVYAAIGDARLLLALPLVVFLLWRSHVHGWCEWGILFAGPIRRLFGQQTLYRTSRPTHSAQATLMLLVEWIPMLAGISYALDNVLGLPAACLLGAIYMVASIGSLLFFVVPSGLVVREAMFVWLGLRYGFEPPMLVFIGLVLRAATTLAEVASAVVFAAADIVQRRFSSSFRPHGE